MGIVMLPILLAGVLVHAQEPLRPRVVAPIPVEERVAALEQRVTTLEQQNAELRKFLVITGNALAIRMPDNGNLSLEAKTGNITVVTQAGNMTLETRMGNMNVQAKMGDMTLETQLGKITAKAMSGVAIESSAALRMKAVADVSVTGGRVLVNGGRRPVARTGDPAPGGVIAGGSPTFLAD